MRLASPALVGVQMAVAREEIDHQKKGDAGDEINAQRMHMARAFSFDEFIR